MTVGGAVIGIPMLPASLGPFAKPTTLRGTPWVCCRTGWVPFL